MRGDAWRAARGVNIARPLRGRREGGGKTDEDLRNHGCQLAVSQLVYVRQEPRDHCPPFSGTNPQ
eukprot:446580-Prymnesium_polylepis.1